MNVRIIGNESTGYRVVNSKTNAVVGFASNYSACLLIVSQRGWTKVR